MNQMPGSLPAQNFTGNLRIFIFSVLHISMEDNSSPLKKDQTIQRLREQGIMILADGS